MPHYNHTGRNTVMVIYANSLDTVISPKTTVLIIDVK
jgi:hypothetical protein